jgi:hypothetical protein
VQGYCDRIVYYSTPDLAESLIPEKVVVSLDFTQPATVVMANNNNKKANSIRESIDSKLSSEKANHMPNLTKIVDNYQSILEGMYYEVGYVEFLI